MRKYLVCIWSMILACMVIAMIRGTVDQSIGLFPAFGLGWTMVELRYNRLLRSSKNH